MDISQISFELAVILGNASLPMQAYRGLQIGDVLVLDQLIDKELTAQVGTEKYFHATAGLFETHKAILIDERVYT